MEWYLQLLLSIVAGMGIGAFWYSGAGFGNWWVKHAYPKKNLDTLDQSGMPLGLALAVGGNGIACSILQTTFGHLTFVNDLGSGAAAGLIAALFMALPWATHFAFEKRPFDLYVIHALLHTTQLVVAGAIFGHFK